MIPSPPDRVLPITPQHVALLFSVNQQDESRPISLDISHPLWLSVLLIIQPHTVLLLSHVPYMMCLHPLLEHDPPI